MERFRATPSAASSGAFTRQASSRGRAPSPVARRGSASPRPPSRNPVHDTREYKLLEYINLPGHDADIKRANELLHKYKKNQFLSIKDQSFIEGLYGRNDAFLRNVEDVLEEAVATDGKLRNSAVRQAYLQWREINAINHRIEEVLTTMHRFKNGGTRRADISANIGASPVRGGSVPRSPIGRQHSPMPLSRTQSSATVGSVRGRAAGRSPAPVQRTPSPGVANLLKQRRDYSPLPLRIRSPRPRPLPATVSEVRRPTAASYYVDPSAAVAAPPCSTNTSWSNTSLQTPRVAGISSPAMNRTPSSVRMFQQASLKNTLSVEENIMRLEDEVRAIGALPELDLASVHRASTLFVAIHGEKEGQRTFHKWLAQQPIETLRRLRDLDPTRDTNVE